MTLIQKINAQPNSSNAPMWFAQATYASLIKLRTPQSTAAGWANVYASCYSYLRVQPALLNAATVYQIRRAFGRATPPAGPDWINIYGDVNNAASLLSAARHFDASFGIGAGSGFVLAMQVYAKANNIPINGCALSIATVSLDLAGMAAGGATALSGVGAVLFVMSAAGAVIDIGSLTTSCGP